MQNKAVAQMETDNKTTQKCNCDCHKKLKEEIKMLKQQNLNLINENNMLKKFIGVEYESSC